MIRVLTFAPNVYDGTSFYRLGGVIPYLEKEHKDIHIKDMSSSKEIDWADYASYDVAIFQRPFVKPHLSTINMLKLMGVKVIIDYDDDVLNLPMHNPFFSNYDSNKNNIIEIAKSVDSIWVSTPALKETFSVFNDNVIVIPNALNDYVFNVEKKMPFNRDSKVVAYRGGTTHEVDVYKNINDWASIINTNLDYSFYFIGARFPYLESKCGDNYLIIPGTHILDYFRNFNKINPNIFIYSLEDTQFNRCKSNISWIEATYAGAAVLGPEFHGEFIKPGIKNFGDSFVREFNSLKKNYDKLEQMNKESWEYIKSKLLLSNVNKKRYESLLEVKNRK